MDYEHRMETVGRVYWLTPRTGCSIKLEDGSLLKTGDRISSSDPIARTYRHRLMALSAAPDPPEPEPRPEPEPDG